MDLEENENTEKEMRNQIINYAEENQQAFYEKKQQNCENKKAQNWEKEGNYFLGSLPSVPFQPSLDLDAHCSYSFHLFMILEQMCFSAVARSQPWDFP